MQLVPLTIEGSFELIPRIFSDDRGDFLEWYRHDALREAVGHPLELAQANCSVSRRGVVRGIHFASVPAGQAKYVTCVVGSILDVVVDIRVDSPTYGAVVAVPLDDQKRSAVYLSEGLGHGFCVLSETATVAYLCSTVYNPVAEHGISPTDPDLDLPWLTDPALMGAPMVLSDKDTQAPTLEQARAAGLLPTMAACAERAAELRSRAQ